MPTWQVLRVISVAPRLRRVGEGLVIAFPGKGSVYLLLAIILYIGAAIATKLSAAIFPMWFGALLLVPYSLAMTFADVNLLIGVIVNFMQDARHIRGCGQRRTHRDGMTERLGARAAGLAALSRQSEELVG